MGKRRCGEGEQATGPNSPVALVISGKTRSCCTRSTTASRLKASEAEAGPASGTTTPNSRSRPAAKRTSTNQAPVEASQIKRKSTACGSSTSIITRTTTPKRARNDPGEDFEKITESQRLFWEECRDNFPFDSTFSMNVEQCIVAKAQYVICGLEEGIVRSMMDFLVKLGEINQR